MELREGELYGAAIARAYELESEVAGYPRIVVGEQVLDYFAAQRSRPESDVFVKTDQALATICAGMLIRDMDGRLILHYLGEEFQAAASGEAHADLYTRGKAFVLEQLDTHQKARNSKLAFRYGRLAEYFEAFPPTPKDAEAGKD